MSGKYLFNNYLDVTTRENSLFHVASDNKTKTDSNIITLKPFAVEVLELR